MVNEERENEFNLRNAKKYGIDFEGLPQEVEEGDELELVEIDESELKYDIESPEETVDEFPVEYCKADRIREADYNENEIELLAPISVVSADTIVVDSGIEKTIFSSCSGLSKSDMSFETYKQIAYDLDVATKVIFSLAPKSFVDTYVGTHAQLAWNKKVMMEKRYPALKEREMSDALELLEKRQAWDKLSDEQKYHRREEDVVHDNANLSSKVVNGTTRAWDPVQMKVVEFENVDKIAFVKVHAKDFTNNNHKGRGPEKIEVFQKAPRTRNIQKIISCSGVYEAPKAVVNKSAIFTDVQDDDWDPEAQKAILQMIVDTPQTIETSVVTSGTGAVVKSVESESKGEWNKVGNAQKDKKKEEQKKQCALTQKLMLSHTQHTVNVLESKANFDRKFPIKNASTSKSQVCASIAMKQRCKHGDRCRFAHSIGELTPSQCRFGFQCRSGKSCQYIHTGEDKVSYCERLRIKFK